MGAQFSRICLVFRLPFFKYQNCKKMSFLRLSLFPLRARNGREEEKRREEKRREEKRREEKRREEKRREEQRRDEKRGEELVPSMFYRCLENLGSVGVVV